MFIKTKMRFKSQTFPIETICGPLAICSTRCRMGSSNSNKRSAALDLCILPILAFPPGNTRRPHGAHINGNIFVYLYLCICVFVFVYLYLCIHICVFINKCNNFQSFFDKLTSDQFRVHPMQCFHFRDVSPEDTHFMKTFVWSLSEGGRQKLNSLTSDQTNIFLKYLCCVCSRISF